MMQHKAPHFLETRHLTKRVEQTCLYRSNSEDKTIFALPKVLGVVYSLTGVSCCVYWWEMKIIQHDILGAKLVVNEKSEKQKPFSVAAVKGYVDVTLATGFSESQATSDFMLVHRILQKKLIASGLMSKNSTSCLLKIVMNEMNIKAGNIEASSATRDSLLLFFMKV
ncbi:MAG: hypothetical protein LBT03_00660 [Holosporales bacterium]|jgi:hypothetical protein|nr:hypothetical protein [Holosporales bacterium]